MKHILITGASTGIGHHLIEPLLQKGHTVWAGVRKLETVEGFQKRHPHTFHSLKLDVTSEVDIARAFDQISKKDNIREFILINNAGIALGGPVEAIPIVEWKKLFEVNVFGLVQTTQKFLPLLRKTKGRVINIGSISGRMATPNLAPYAASKFAVRAISDSLRREMLFFGVKVILIEPGPIKTDIWEKSLESSQKLSTQIDPEIARIYKKSIDAMIKAVEQTAKMAVPTDRVTEKVLIAVDDKEPAPYYLVGKLIELQNLIIKTLPTKILDKMLSTGFRFKK